MKGKGRKGEICGAVENERGKRTFAAENAIPENAYRSAMMVVPFARSSSIDLLRHTTITLSAQRIARKARDGVDVTYAHSHRFAAKSRWIARSSISVWDNR